MGALLLLGLGCVRGPNHFRPSERVGGVDPDGNRLAFYELRGPSGVFGEATLWTRGATAAQRDGAERTFVHVGIAVQNTSDKPATIDQGAVRLLDVRTSRGTVPELAPITPHGLVVAPGSSARREWFFELPAGVDPRDVYSFELEWAVRGDAQRYAKRTPFIELRRGDRYGPDTYVVYDPFYPYYYRYHAFGYYYCADPFCHHVVYPVRPYPPRRGNRTRSHPRR